MCRTREENAADLAYDETRAPTAEDSGPELYMALCNLIEWAKGSRGPKTGNPYEIPEVKRGLEVIAKIQGIDNYLDADTNIGE